MHMKTLIVIVALVSVSSAFAQEYTFKVLINKGQNTVKAGNNWLPIKVGANLKTADELRVSANGYLGLVHVSGKPLEVKEAGPYKVVDLAGKIKAGKSVLNKYTDFILSSKTESGSNLMATGAVSRGTEKIKLYLPEAKQAVVLNDEVSVMWSRDPDTKVYVVQFNSMFGDELDRHEVQDTTLTINLKGPKFVNEDNIVLKVFSKKDPTVESQEFVLKKVSAADKQRLTNSLKDMESLMAEKNALNELYLANFYEENTLFIDASTAYQNAMKLAPQVPDFKTAFHQFVARNQLRN